MDPIDYAKLSEPFAPDEIEWRVGNVAKSGKRCTLLAYLTARAVMDRLDAVVGPDRWMNSYDTGPGGGIVCTISIVTDGGEWVAKSDGAENTQIEAIKGGLSGALKRAAVLWGIGRYLYRLEATWEDIQEGWANGRGIDVSQNRRHIGWVRFPQLPSFALPAGGSGGSAGRAPLSDPTEGQDKAEPQDAAQSRTEPPTHAPVEAPKLDGEQRPPLDSPKQRRGYDPAAPKHPSWAADSKRFFAKLNELCKVHLGMEVPDAYARVKALCAAQGWPKPSALPQEKRDGFLRHLEQRFEASDPAFVDHFMPF